MLSVVLKVGKGMPPKAREGRSWVAIAAETWGTDILRERSYLWLVASRLFFLTAGGILFAYVTAYMKYVFGMTQEEAGATNLVLIVAIVLGNVVTIVPASRLSDRIGRKPIIYAACGCGALGAGIAAVAPTVPIAIVGGTLFGAANGIFLAVDWALMTDIIPRASAGRYMGISNVATGSAPLFAAAIGGLVLDIVAGQSTDAAGARAAFMVGVALFLVAAVLLRPVVEPPRHDAPCSRPRQPGRLSRRSPRRPWRLVSTPGRVGRHGDRDTHAARRSIECVRGGRWPGVPCGTRAPTARSGRAAPGGRPPTRTRSGRRTGGGAATTRARPTR